MAEATITFHQRYWDYPSPMPIAMTVVTMLAAMQVIIIGRNQPWAYTHWRIALAGPRGLLKMADLYYASSNAQRVRALGIVILYQVGGVLALPVSSRETVTDIAKKSYNLSRTSFITMAVMGAVMTAIALIKGAIAIIKWCSKQKPCEDRTHELPRHPVNCQNSAAAHAALGQRISVGAADADCGQELSSSVPDTISSEDVGRPGSLEPDGKGPSERIMPMPAERLSSARVISPSVETERE